jgi:hypothetical protein
MIFPIWPLMPVLKLCCVPKVKQATTSEDVVTKVSRQPITTQYVILPQVTWLCDVYDRQPHRLMRLPK